MNSTITSTTSLLVVLLITVALAVIIPLCNGAGAGIPGTTATDSGYDTEKGIDPICWQSQGATSTGEIDFPNPLIKGYKITGSVQLLRRCPVGNSLSAEKPKDSILKGNLRTRRWYNYTVKTTINLSSLNSTQVVADNGTYVAMQIIVCELGSAGFCSPFIHEEANFRLNQIGIHTTVKRGDRHGGTHVHSPYMLLHLKPEDGPFYAIDQKVPMIVNDPGSFFAIAAIHLFVRNTSTSINGTTNLIRYDMANALVADERLITYQTPAIILEVPVAVLMLSYAAIGLVSSVIVYLLLETIRHRQQRVLKLTQGTFLIIFLIAELIASASCFLLEPRNDLFCNVAYPVILVSLHTVFAVTIGRLWRINAVLSPLLIKTLRRQENPVMAWLRNFVSAVSSKSMDKPRKLRKHVSELQLAIVVTMFVFPQLAMQILTSIVQPRHRSIQWDSEYSTGRAICTTNHKVGTSLDYYCFYVFVILVISLVVMAAATQSLPSLFNETKVILDSALSTLVFVVVGVGVLVLTNNPTVTPAVPYMVWVGLVLSTTLNTSLRIMLPKLRMVWSGETILVSQLVSDNSKGKSVKSPLLHNVTGFSPTQTKVSGLKSGTDDHSDSCEVLDEMEQFKSPNYGVESTMTLTGHRETALDTGQENGDVIINGMLSKPLDLSTRHLGLDPSRHTTSQYGPVKVKRNKAPPRRLVLKMINLQEMLSRVNQRIMSGLVVSDSDWSMVRLLSIRLGHTFHDEVQFEWDEDVTGGNGGEDTFHQE